MGKKGYISVLLLVLFMFLSNVFNNVSAFNIPDKVINSVVFVMQEVEKDNKKEDIPVGSGFLIGVGTEKGSLFSYFVTARHVVDYILSEGRKTLKLRFSRVNDEGGEVIPFETDSYNGKQWLEHKNKYVDLAVIPIGLFNNEKIEAAGVKWVMYTATSPTGKFFATADWIKIHEVTQGFKVFTVGLSPFIYNRAEKNLVLSRFGTISFLMEKEFDFPPPLNWGVQKVYFVDCPTFGGNSGGPVYVYSECSECSGFIPETRVALLGIITGFIPSELRKAYVEVPEKELTKTKKKELRKKVEVGLENTGIARIVPVDYLVDILFSDELKKARENAENSIYGIK